MTVVPDTFLGQKGIQSDMFPLAYVYMYDMGLNRSVRGMK